MSYSHTLNLALKTESTIVNNKKTDLHMIEIHYRYKGNRKRRRSDITVRKKHWDMKERMIKTDYQSEYPQEIIDHLYDMKKQFNALRIALRENSISYTTAFNKLLKKGSDEVDLLQFLNNSNECKKFSPKSKKKYSSYIKACNKHLLAAGETTLTTVNVVDEAFCRSLNDILRNAPSISRNTRHDYLSKLDTISKQTDNLKNCVFNSEGLIPTLIDTSRDPVAFDSLMEGINDIRTLQDLESYLFWLYSFCLLGLDATDIINLDESMVANKGDKIKTQYHPESSFDIQFDRLSEKVHLRFFRKKSQIPMTICINLIPILFIRDWIHYLVKITRPEYAYKGNDRLKIYNFKTILPSGKDDMEGEDKKKKILDTYTDKTKRMFGGVLQQSRHTVTAQGQENGLTENELNRQLGHQVKGSLKHYLTNYQIPKDVNHIHIIQEFGLLDILRSIIKKVEEMTELRNSEAVEFIYWTEEDLYGSPDKPIDSKNEMLAVIRTINAEGLTQWSAADEKRFQQLMAKVSKGKWEVINGVNVKTEITKDLFPDELKELIAKKELLMEEKSKEAKAKAREWLKKNNRTVYDKIQAWEKRIGSEMNVKVVDKHTYFKGESKEKIRVKMGLEKGKESERPKKIKA